MEEPQQRARALVNRFRPAVHAPTRPTLRNSSPFVVVALIGVSSVYFPPYQDVHWLELALVAVGLIITALFLRSSLRRTHRTWVDPMAAFVFFGVYALARDAGGGVTAGLAPLVALPIFWLALTGTRRDLRVSIVLTAAVFVIPLVFVGAPDYPASDWRRAILWTSIALVLAPVVQRLVADLAEQRRIAETASAETRGILQGARLTSIIVYAPDGTIRSFSAGAEELLHHRASQVIGRDGLTLIHDPDELESVGAELHVEPGIAVVRRLAEAEAPARVWTLRRGDSAPIRAQVVFTELTDGAGECLGFLSVAIDVTAAVRAEQELARAEARWRTLLDHLPGTTVLLLDEELTIRATGGQSAIQLGLQEARGRHLSEFSQGTNFETLRDMVADALEGREGRTELHATFDGTEQEVLVTRLPDAVDGGVVLLVSRDVSRERARGREAEVARRRAERLFADAPHGVAVLRADGTIVRVNRALEQLLGREAADLVGRELAAFSIHDDQQFRMHLEDVVRRSPELVTIDWGVRGRDGAPVHVVVSSRLLRADPDTGGQEMVLVHVVDVSERRRYEQRLAHLAEHDPLTGLVNRRKFDEELQRHHDLCRRYGATGALLMLDLDQFKEINDSLGRNVGDQLIISTAALLRHSVRSTDVVARLGGDEFAILLADGDRGAALAVGEKLVQRVHADTGTFDSIRRNVTVSIGGVTFADACAGGGDIMALAEMMMYDAKEDGRNRCLVLDASQHQQPRMGARLEWKQRIERALENDDFALLLQPILDLRTNRVHSAEVLLRLADTAELVSPSRFLYVAERSGLASEIDAWVVRHSLPLLERLRRLDPSFVLEVNLSGHSIGDPLIESTIVDELRSSGADPSALILEITETAAVADVEVARAFAERMTALGCQFALDDFGAGFGSFYYLKHLLFDYVKIDGEFVANCHRSAVDRTILRSIVGIAHDLGKQTVAEFVAEDAILDVVRAEGVDLAQGFHIGKPMPIEDLIASLPPSSATDQEVGE